MRSLPLTLWQVAGGLYVAGTVELTVLAIYNNTAAEAKTLYHAGGDATYALPALPGYWLPAGTNQKFTISDSLDNDVPFACSPGLLGGSGNQSTPFCAGPCPAGFVCSGYATIVPTACRRGGQRPATHDRRNAAKRASGGGE